MGLRSLRNIRESGPAAGIRSTPSNLRYLQQMQSIFGASILSLLDTTIGSGTAFPDTSGNGRTATVGNTVLAGATGPDGLPAPVWDGDAANWYTVSLRDAFNGQEFGAKFLIKPDAAALTDGVVHYVGRFRVDASNHVYIFHNGYTFTAFYNAGATARQIEFQLSGSTWYDMLMSVSKTGDALDLFVNGAKGRPTQTALGTWAGLLSSTNVIIGSSSLTPTTTFKGQIVYPMLTNAAPTQAQALAGYRASKITTKKITILGDSISANKPLTGWQALVGRNYNSGQNVVYNRSMAGATIMTDGDSDSDMAAQVTASQYDDADLVIIELGTNDPDDAGITAEYTAQVNRLKAYHPRATICGMGILPRTADATRLINNPRIEAACTATGISYWNTDGVIDPADDTDDGVHPTDAGDVKIDIDIRARL